MRIERKKINDVMEIFPEPIMDERGFFARLYCKDEMKTFGLEKRVSQINNSLSKIKGTTRGLHYQREPYGEHKILRCVSGKILNIIVDINPESETYLQHVEIELDAKSRNMSLVPPHCANGIQTLDDDCELIYFVTETYNRDAENGLRINDPSLSITLPLNPTVISEKDNSWPDWEK